MRDREGENEKRCDNTSRYNPKNELSYYRLYYFS